ncbi:MAG TPA: OmpH family outer membrane protein, partial [bacterium]|nr:OmpH family outer membrane protein [bacterium]
MRNQTVFRCLFFLFVFGLAEARADAKLAFVDSERIMKTHPPALEAQSQLEKENDEWIKELNGMEEQLIRLKRDLEAQSLILSRVLKKEKEQEIMDLTRVIERFKREKWGEDGALMRRQKELLKPIFDQVTRIVHRIADEDGYDFVLDSRMGV